MSGTILWTRNIFGGSENVGVSKFSLEIWRKKIYEFYFIWEFSYGKHNLNYLRCIEHNFFKLFSISDSFVDMFLIRLLSQNRFAPNELLLELNTSQQSPVHCRSISLVEPFFIQAQLYSAMNDNVFVKPGNGRNVKCIYLTLNVSDRMITMRITSNDKSSKLLFVMFSWIFWIKTLTENEIFIAV